MGAGLYTYRRRYITLGIALLAGLGAPRGDVAAQTRVVERHGFNDPEGRLLAFYSASMAFSPAGLAPDESRLSLVLEVSHVPWLNEAQRRPSIDKPEATNLAPVFPRPRIALRAGAWRFEASWIPPLPLFDVEANLASVAVSGPSLATGAMTITPRAWAVVGRVKGSMTCAESEMIGKGPDLELYFTSVCHGRESEDWFDPRMLAGEVIATRQLATTLRGYAVLGARVDRTRFDIGVITDFGARDPDHPIIELSTVRPHIALGGTWQVQPTIAAGAEVFYAPGSLLTARVSARWAVRR